MKDKRLYGKFTLNFPRHPKIAILSDAAFRCLVEAILYSRDELTDGLLARRYAIARWGLEVLQELCENDDENPSLVEVQKGWMIHDYADTQDTKAEVEARSARNKAAGQRGGIAKAKGGAKQVASESLSESLPETETETETTNSVGSVSREPRKRGTRLQSDWIPGESTIAAMRNECPDVNLQAEHRKFVDYWTAKAGKDATKLSWDGTWRNWIRRAAERRATAPGPDSNITAFERKKAHNAAVFHSLADQPNNPELLA